MPSTYHKTASATDKCRNLHSQLTFLDQLLFILLRLFTGACTLHNNIPVRIRRPARKGQESHTSKGWKSIDLVQPHQLPGGQRSCLSFCNPALRGFIERVPLLHPCHSVRYGVFCKQMNLPSTGTLLVIIPPQNRPVIEIIFTPINCFDQCGGTVAIALPFPCASIEVEQSAYCHL